MNEFKKTFSLKTHNTNKKELLMLNNMYNLCHLYSEGVSYIRLAPIYCTLHQIRFGIGKIPIWDHSTTRLKSIKTIFIDPRIDPNSKSYFYRHEIRSKAESNQNANPNLTWSSTWKKINTTINYIYGRIVYNHISNINFIIEYAHSYY